MFYKHCVVILTLTTSLLSCSNNTSKLSHATIIQVDHFTLDANDFSKKLFLKLKNYDSLTVKEPLIISRAREEIIDEFILESLAIKWSQNNGLQLKDAQVKEELTKIRESYPDDLSFRRILAAEGISYDFWLKNVRSTLLQKLVFEKVTETTPEPSPEEIKSHYNANKSLFRTKDRIKIRQIVLKTENNANRLLKEIQKGKSIKELAVKYSIAPEASNEGLVGWVEKGSSEIFDKVFNYGRGRYSSILKSNLGFHIVEILDMKRGEQLSLSDAEPHILATLMQSKKQEVYKRWLDEELRKARIFKNENLIQAIFVETKR